MQAFIFSNVLCLGPPPTFLTNAAPPGPASILRNLPLILPPSHAAAAALGLLPPPFHSPPSLHGTIISNQTQLEECSDVETEDDATKFGARMELRN